ncbi:MAG: glyoxalase [Alphaproteobacteria bacterium PA4]|nr:MAG: glyoxalase [Alphaproteobacteria bacterium PA4]
MPLDHLTILSRDAEAAHRFYALLLPELGFTAVKPGIWKSATGLYVQFKTAKPDTRDYERHGPGLNHLGFTAPDAAFVARLAETMTAGGFEARLQHFADGTTAVFLPDPDGLRVEVSHYPPGQPPVD